MPKKLTSTQPDARQYAPATERNRAPILAVLQKALPSTGTVLEISSGTGEHATFFASQLSHLYWQPSEMNALLINSIQAWAKTLPTPNLLAPIELDVNRQPWPIEYPAKHPVKHKTRGSAASPATLMPPPITALVNINMIHISPWESCEQLINGARRILPKDGVLYLYGPYKQNGKHTAPSNEAFDEILKSRNPHWGIRDLEKVCDIAQQQQLALTQVIPMPANNFSVVFHRQ